MSPTQPTKNMITRQRKLLPDHNHPVSQGLVIISLLTLLGQVH